MDKDLKKRLQDLCDEYETLESQLYSFNEKFLDFFLELPQEIQESEIGIMIDQVSDEIYNAQNTLENCGLSSLIEDIEEID